MSRPPERKHDAYGIPAISEQQLDGLTVYLSTAAAKGTIVCYPTLGAAEQAFGVKSVRASLLWELIKANPGVEIVVQVA